MCLIIDANVASEVRAKNTLRANEVLRWLVERDGMIVYGGKLTDELRKAGLGGLLLELDRAGKAFRVSDHEVLAELAAVNRAAAHASDDPHILALARASGARILYSDDNALRDDFKSKAILGGRAGKVYSDASHKHLLKERKFCPVRATK